MSDEADTRPRRRWWRWAALALVALIAAYALYDAPRVLPAEQLADLERPLAERVSEIEPRPEEESWLRIPWRHDILAARDEAIREGKPLFLWLMDGNPLAST